MRNREQSDNDKRLSHQLRRARPEPVLPARFAESVWRRIECLESRQELPGLTGWAERFLTRLLRPRLAAVTALVLVLTGTVAGIISGTSNAQEPARARYVAAVAPQPIR